MYQLTRLGSATCRQRLERAEQQRPVQRLLALRRAPRRAERADWRMHRAERQVRRLRTQPGTWTTPPAITRRRRANASHHEVEVRDPKIHGRHRPA